MNVSVIVGLLIALVLGVAIASSLGTTIIDKTETRTCLAMLSNETSRDCSLENASDTSKTMYGLVELMYPIMLVMFMVTVGLAVKSRYG